MKETNEAKRKEDIENLQSMYSQGYSKADIKRALRTTYRRINKYLSGDPSQLCKDGRGNGNRGVSKYDRYYEEAATLYKKGLSRMEIYRSLISKGYDIKKSCFIDYCTNRFSFIVKQRNVESYPIQNHFVSRSIIFSALWSSSELPLSEADKEKLLSKYPLIEELEQCIRDFREIFDQQSVDMLDKFIQQYSASPIRLIASFAFGLSKDYDAVRNSVLFSYSNGFVEGDNNRLKMIKRTMYGRAQMPLMKAKVLLPQFLYS